MNMVRPLKGQAVASIQYKFKGSPTPCLPVFDFSSVLHYLDTVVCLDVRKIRSRERRNRDGRISWQVVLFFHVKCLVS